MKLLRATVLLFCASSAFLWVSCESPEGPLEYIVETYAHVRPAWSPDGLTIAFTNQLSGQSGIYLVDSSGSNVRLLKSGEGVGLSWSPDSKWIIFSANGGLHKIKANADSLTQLAAGPGYIRPAWSPDDKAVAFQNNGIKLFRFATGQITTLYGGGYDPSWTPTGSVLFMTSTSGGTPIIYAFQTIDTAGSQLQLVHEFRSSFDCGFGSMNSPGNMIVFSAKSFSGLQQTRVVKFNLGTLGLEELTIDGGDYPAWSPDGTMIVYTRTQKGDGGLWVMNADGSNKRRLTQP